MWEAFVLACIVSGGLALLFTFLFMHYVFSEEREENY